MAATTGDLGDRLSEDAVAEVMAAVHAGVAAAADVSPQGAAAPSSGVRVICHGVEPIVGTGLWLSTVPVRGVLRAVGHFRGADAAARAHDMMMLRLWPSLAPSTLNFPIAEYAEGSPWMAAYTRGERARPSPQAADARGIAAPTASAPAESTPGVALVDMRCKTVPDALAREEVDASCLGDDQPSSSGGGGRGADALATVLPDCLPVVCGTARGQLLTESMTVLLDGGSSQVRGTKRAADIIDADSDRRYRRMPTPIGLVPRCTCGKVQFGRFLLVANAVYEGCSRWRASSHCSYFDKQTS